MTNAARAVTVGPLAWQLRRQERASRARARRLITLGEHESLVAIGRAFNAFVRLPKLSDRKAPAKPRQFLDLVLSNQALYFIVDQSVVRYGFGELVDATIQGVNAGPQYLHARLQSGERLLLSLDRASELARHLDHQLEMFENSLSHDELIERYWQKEGFALAEARRAVEAKRRKLYDARWNLHNVGRWIEGKGWIESTLEGAPVIEGRISIDHVGIRVSIDDEVFVLPYETIVELGRTAPTPALRAVHPEVLGDDEAELVCGLARANEEDVELMFAVQPVQGSTEQWLAELQYWMDVAAADSEAAAGS